MSETSPSQQTIEREYEAYTAGVSLKNSWVASGLVVILMPAGTWLERCIYPERQFEFLVLRLINSALAALVFFRLWFLIEAAQTSPTRTSRAIPSRLWNWFLMKAAQTSPTQTKLLCMSWWVLPAFFMSWMIAVTEGAQSPYYAGLCLVILAVSTVIQATLRESLRAFLWIVGFYLAACLINPLLTGNPVDLQMLGNNMYFIIVTSIIVLVGNHNYNDLRFREFRAKKELEATLEMLRQAQDELVINKKQASLGVWSAGIIHEINNPLNIVITGIYNLRHVEQHLPASERPEFKEVFHDIEDSARRMRDIVSDLRSYAHTGSDQLTFVELEEVMRMVLLEEALDGRIEVIQEVPPGFSVFAKRTGLIQVLTNLVQNAAHALADKQFTTGQPTITITGREEGSRRLVIIHDNGPGITKENQEKIFDPFYTTKAPGQGMGLGLGICYTIIKNFGGSIRVKSEPGEFCEVTLDLPAERPDANES